jgi:hypothetical protein
VSKNRLKRCDSLILFTAGDAVAFWRKQMNLSAGPVAAWHRLGGGFKIIKAIGR